MNVSGPVPAAAAPLTGEDAHDQPFVTSRDGSAKPVQGRYLTVIAECLPPFAAHLFAPMADAEEGEVPHLGMTEAA